MHEAGRVVPTALWGNVDAPIGGVCNCGSYAAGSSRVAMSVNGTVAYLLTDQLGSTSITALGDGTKVSELRYKAWG